jgi:hypothetical protein
MLRSACGTHRLLLDELTANDDEPPRFDEAPFRSMKYGRGVFTRPYEETLCKRAESVSGVFARSWREGWCSDSMIARMRQKNRLERD